MNSYKIILNHNKKLQTIYGEKKDFLEDDLEDCSVVQNEQSKIKNYEPYTCIAAFSLLGN